MGVILKYKVYNKHRPADFIYFSNIKDIKKYTKDTHKSISMAIINNYQTDNGFYIEKVIEEAKPPKIIVFDARGNIYKTFKSKSECMKNMRLGYNTLTKLIEDGNSDGNGYTYDLF